MTLISAVALVCFPHAEMVAHLDTQKNQSQVVAAQEDRGALVEVYVSELGSWSMVITNPDLRSCIIGTGTQWMIVPWGELS